MARALADGRLGGRVTGKGPWAQHPGGVGTPGTGLRSRLCLDKLWAHSELVKLADPWRRPSRGQRTEDGDRGLLRR